MNRHWLHFIVELIRTISMYLYILLYLYLYLSLVIDSLMTGAAFLTSCSFPLISGNGVKICLNELLKYYIHILIICKSLFFFFAFKTQLKWFQRLFLIFPQFMHPCARVFWFYMEDSSECSTLFRSLIVFLPLLRLPHFFWSCCCCCCCCHCPVRIWAR